MCLLLLVLLRVRSASQDLLLVLLRGRSANQDLLLALHRVGLDEATIVVIVRAGRFARQGWSVRRAGRFAGLG